MTSVVSSQSELNLFADDIALYRIIKSPADYDQLQIIIINFIDKDFLYIWETSEVLCREVQTECLCRGKLPQPPLTVDGTPLTVVTEYKYLGVIAGGHHTLQTHAPKVGG